VVANTFNTARIYAGQISPVVESYRFARRRGT
jgi:hypothetical protein